MYDKSDPRASLKADETVAAEYAGVEYGRFYEQRPSEELEMLRVWYARGQNFVLAYVEADAGAMFVRLNQPDEYVLLQPDAGTSIEIDWKDTKAAVPGRSITMIPDGASRLRVLQGGRLVLLFTTRSDDLCKKCLNAESYAVPHPNIPPFQAWPDAVGEKRVHSYGIDVPDEPGRFGRIWRCSTFMINFLPPQNGPRDVTKLSPHSHAFFEQGSFALDGAFVHHVRWPWTPNMNSWRADDHERCESPSLAVIPPPAIHTSRGVELGVNQLVDIFSPPRTDFSLKEGWVLNADDYPMPRES